ncbi:MAG TPA: phospholipase D family protein [Burkholderiaceae bacterium]|nr:phospholipase D family protein [Burkholderiaceae bacterium]
MSVRALHRALLWLVMLAPRVSAHAFEPLPAPVAARGTIQAAFAPWNDIEGVLVDAIDAAKKQVLVQAYLLTGKKMTQALLRAHQRGVAVRVLMDAEQIEKTPASQALTLAEAGISVWLETGYQNAHNKVIIIDAHTSAPVLITGSFNFTWAAAHKNAENVLVMRDDPELILLYVANWERHQRAAMAYRR